MRKGPSAPPTIRFGDRVFIEPFEGTEGFSSSIVGLKEPLYLIIENPLSKETSLRLTGSPSLWIRLIQQMVYRFQSRILRVLWDPVPLLFVQFPVRMEPLNLRREGRRKVFIQTDIFDLHQEVRKVAFRGYILDISMNGALILADLANRIGEMILLVFRVSWIMENFQLKARVIRCEASEEGVRCGVQFQELEPASIRSLETLIQTIERKDFPELP